MVRKLSETGTKTFVISLANYSIKNHLIPSYREKVLTVLVEPCPKTRNQVPAEFTNFNCVFRIRFQSELYEIYAQTEAN